MWMEHTNTPPWVWGCYLDHTSKPMLTLNNISYASLNLFAIYSHMYSREKKSISCLIHKMDSWGSMTSPEKSLFRHMNRPNIIKRRCILGYQHSSPVFLPIVALLPELSEPIYPRISVLPIQWQLLFELLSILQCDVLSRESQCKSKQVSLSFAGCSL